MSRSFHLFRARDKTLEMGKTTRLMGVVNVTPDSFSDGGQYLESNCAIEHCLRLVEEGADLIDLGAESSRPGAQPVELQEELDRLLPVLEKVRDATSVLISVDTYKAAVAESVLRCGADVINDIGAFRLDPPMAEVVSRWKAGVILMHMRGTPAVMHTLPPSQNILNEVRDDLQVAVNKAYKSNIQRDRIILDPGIGFGKNAEESLQLVNRLSILEDLKLPILVGTSRKSFIGAVLNRPVGERLLGTAASVVAAILRGAHVLRVHDVSQLREVSKMADAILAESLPE
jgi:dihydropteroate synthase